MPVPFYDFGLSSRPSSRVHSRARASRFGYEASLNKKKISIVIADDHPILRDGIHALLRMEPDFRVVGEAADGNAAVQLSYELKPNILLLDWAMARRDGMQILQELDAGGLPVRTLLTTVQLNNSEILRALQLGAWGVIPRDSTTKMLYEGIRKVMSGQYWIGRESVASLVDALRDFTPNAASRPSRRDFGLTRRELEIVASVMAGYSNADIAHRVSLSEHTVKHHLGHIFDKLGVSNRLELALFAVNHQLIGDDR